MSCVSTAQRREELHECLQKSRSPPSSRIQTLGVVYCNIRMSVGVTDQAKASTWESVTVTERVRSQLPGCRPSYAQSFRKTGQCQGSNWPLRWSTEHPQASHDCNTRVSGSDVHHTNPTMSHIWHSTRPTHTHTKAQIHCRDNGLTVLAGSNLLGLCGSWIAACTGLQSESC